MDTWIAIPPTYVSAGTMRTPPIPIVPIRSPTSSPMASNVTTTTVLIATSPGIGHGSRHGIAFASAS